METLLAFVTQQLESYAALRSEILFELKAYPPAAGAVFADRLLVYEIERLERIAQAGKGDLL
jgi:hypothetical protein